MKRLLLSVVMVGLLAAQAQADVFDLSQDAAMMLWDTFENPTSATTQILAVTEDVGVYGVPMSGAVGVTGILYAPPTDPYFPWAAIGVGANFWGTSSTGSGATTAQVIGATLNTAPTNSLVGFDTYRLFIENDNNSKWSVNLYMNTGFTDAPFSEPDNFYQGTWTELGPGESTVLTLDLSGVANLNHVTNIGFMVGANLSDVDGNPSNSDVFHVSVVPVPAAFLLGILGLGAAGVKLRKHA